MLTLIKSVHTFIFLFMSACILYIWYAALTRTYTVLLAVALGAVALETVVYLANGRRCPLTHLAQQHGDAGGHDWIADLFLPDWAARAIPSVCGALLVLGLLALVVLAIFR